MPNFYQVYPSYWENAHRDGWTDDEVVLGLYLLTCRHRNLEGLYRLPLGYIAEDRGWTLERVQSAMAGLCAHGFVAYDLDAGVVFIVRALHWQCPKGARQITGAVAALAALPKTALMRRLVDTASEVWPPFAEALSKAYPPDPDTPSDTPSNGYPTVDHESQIPLRGGIRGSSRVPDTPSKGYPLTVRKDLVQSQSQSQSQNKHPLSSPPELDDETGPVETRADVAALCDLFAELIRGNDPRAKVSPSAKAWRDPMRLLLDADGRDPVEVEAVIRFVTSDEFERSNVLCPAKLRKRYTALLLKAGRGKTTPQTAAEFSKYDRAAGLAP